MVALSLNAHFFGTRRRSAVCAAKGRDHTPSSSWFARRVRPRLAELERHKKANWARVVEFAGRVGRDDVRFMHKRAEDVSDVVHENLNRWCATVTAMDNDDEKNAKEDEEDDHEDDHELRL